MEQQKKTPYFSSTHLQKHQYGVFVVLPFIIPC
jgi:hypothetical protein